MDFQLSQPCCNMSTQLMKKKVFVPLSFKDSQDVILPIILSVICLILVTFLLSIFSSTDNSLIFPAGGHQHFFSCLYPLSPIIFSSSLNNGTIVDLRMLTSAADPLKGPLKDRILNGFPKLTTT